MNELHDYKPISHGGRGGPQLAMEEGVPRGCSGGGRAERPRHAAMHGRGSRSSRTSVAEEEGLPLAVE